MCRGRKEVSDLEEVRQVSDVEGKSRSGFSKAEQLEP